MARGTAAPREAALATLTAPAAPASTRLAAQAGTPLPAAPDSAPTASLPERNRWRGVAMALGLVALVAALGAALLAAGIFDGEEAERSAGSANGEEETASSAAGGATEEAETDVEDGGKELEDGAAETEATEDAETSDTSQAVAYSTDSFSAEYPSGWTVTEDDVLKTTYSRSKFVSPDGSMSVLIDHSPGQDAAPSESAASVESQTSQTAGYERLSFEETTLGGRPAFEWTFSIDSVRKIDVFLTAGGDGYAVLGEGADFDQVIGIARDVAASIQPLG